jgi:hypothetical protein
MEQGELMYILPLNWIDLSLIYRKIVDINEIQAETIIMDQKFIWKQIHLSVIHFHDGFEVDCQIDLIDYHQLQHFLCHM